MLSILVFVVAVLALAVFPVWSYIFYRRIDERVIRGKSSTHTTPRIGEIPR
jgi:hypothetical protein